MKKIRMIIFLAVLAMTMVPATAQKSKLVTPEDLLSMHWE